MPGLNPGMTAEDTEQARFPRIDRDLAPHPDSFSNAAATAPPLNQSLKNRNHRLSSAAQPIHSTHHSGDRTFRPTIPATMRPIQASRSALALSPSSAMPRMTVPTVPIPVQTA